MNIRLIAYAILILVISSCKRNSSIDQSELQGVWQAVANDTIYAEVIFSSKKMHSVDNGEGNMLIIAPMTFAYSNMTFSDHLREYKIDNDTLKIVYGDIVQPAFKISKINSDEYVGYHPDFTSKLTRIQDDEKILKSLTSEKLSWESSNFSNYLAGFRARKDKWEKERKSDH